MSYTLPGMDLVIRPADPAEYTALGEITAQAYLQDGLLDFGESDAYLGELRDVARRAADALILVAVRGDVLLGGVTFVPAGGPMADIAGPGEAEIRMLAVARAGRGQGAGRRSYGPAWTGHGPSRAAGASSCPPSRRCTPPTGSTNASVSGAPRTATGTPCRACWTSSCSVTS